MNEGWWQQGITVLLTLRDGDLAPNWRSSRADVFRVWVSENDSWQTWWRVTLCCGSKATAVMVNAETSHSLRPHVAWFMRCVQHINCSFTVMVKAEMFRLISCEEVTLTVTKFILVLRKNGFQVLNPEEISASLSLNIWVCVCVYGWICSSYFLTTQFKVANGR